MMQQQDLTYSSLARKQLDELKMADNDFPGELDWHEWARYIIELPVTININDLNLGNKLEWK